MIRAVLVDDADAYRELVKVVLEETGRFQVVGEAENGEEAIEVVAVTQPDLVLLDISMPVMDGIEALPHLRKAAPEAVVIVLTGFELDAVGDLHGLGATAALEKGLDPVGLVDHIEDAFETSRVESV